MKVLIIDNNKYKLASKWITRFINYTPLEIVYCNGLKFTFGKKYYPFDSYIISGTLFSVHDHFSWINEQKELIRWIIQNNKKLLGICFGLQLICETIWPGSVFRLDKPQIGWGEIKILDSNCIFKGLSQSIVALNYNYYGIKLGTTEIKEIAESKNGHLQGMKIKGKPVWGTQFHVEVLPEDTYEYIDKIKKDYREVEKLEEVSISDALYELIEPNTRGRIFHNFLFS